MQTVAKKRSNRGKGFTSTSQIDVNPLALLVLWMTSTTSLSSTATLNGWKFWNTKDLPQICTIGFLHKLFARFGVVIVQIRTMQRNSRLMNSSNSAIRIRWSTSRLRNTIQGQTDSRRGLWTPWRGLWKRHKALRQIGSCNSFCRRIE